MKRPTTIALGIALGALLLPPQLDGQESRSSRERIDDPEEVAESKLPPFCRKADTGHARAGRGHPKFGLEWCQVERLGLHGEDGVDVEATVSQGRYLEKFCQTGEGHPEFGFLWCNEKMNVRMRLSAGARLSPAEMHADGAAGQETWCLTGQGHPEFGMRWCNMTEEQRAELQERASLEDRDKKKIQPPDRPPPR